MIVRGAELTFFAILALLVAISIEGRASEGPAGCDTFAALFAEYAAAEKRYSEEERLAREAAKKAGDEAIRTFRFDKPSPQIMYSRRFLAIVEANPKGPDAVDALAWTLWTSYGPDFEPLETRAEAIKILAAHYTMSPKILRVIRVAAGLEDDDARAFIDDVIARNPDRTLQARAYQVRANAREAAAAYGERLRTDEKERSRLEASRGKDYVSQQIARAERARREADDIRRILLRKFPDVVADLSIGQHMPPLVSEDLKGRPVTLDDVKGKVVVLDFWTTFCGPCKAMIPHQREMVARLRGERFALVSISCDDQKKTLVDFLAREPMPWNHWWNGSEGRLRDALNIQRFPTIFVLDPGGVIRYKQIRGEELEKAVNMLLDEAKIEPK